MLVIIRFIYAILGVISLILCVLNKYHICGFKITNKIIGVILGSTFLVCLSLFVIDYFLIFLFGYRNDYVAFMTELTDIFIK